MENKGKEPNEKKIISQEEFHKKEQIEISEADIEKALSEIDFSMLEEFLPESMKKSKSQPGDQSTETSKEEKTEEKTIKSTEMIFRKISNKFTPFLDMIFGFVNELLKSKSVKPFNETEQKQIIAIFIDFTSSAFVGRIEDAEDFIKSSKSLPKYIRLFAFLIFSIFPRVLTYSKLKKGAE